MSDHMKRFMPDSISDGKQYDDDDEPQYDSYGLRSALHDIANTELCRRCQAVEVRYWNDLCTECKAEEIERLVDAAREQV